MAVAAALLFLFDAAASAHALRRRRASLLALVAQARLANASQHIALTAVTRSYVPGVATAPLVAAHSLRLLKASSVSRRPRHLLASALLVPLAAAAARGATRLVTR